MSTHLSAVAPRSFENDQNSDLEQARNEFASALAQWEKDGGEKAAEIRQRSSMARDAVQDACSREEEVSKPAWYRNSNQTGSVSLMKGSSRTVSELCQNYRPPAGTTGHKGRTDGGTRAGDCCQWCSIVPGSPRRFENLKFAPSALRCMETPPE